MINYLKNNDYFKLITIFLVSIILDYLFFINISNPPGWDQGYHLSNLFKMYNIVDANNLNFINRLDNLINVTDNYRGPLTYFLSSLVLKLFGNNYNFAYLSNHIFNLISIFSIYEISKYFKDKKTGIWASIFFVFSPLIVKERSDYLIDLSLSSFSILNIFILTKWKTDKSTLSFYSLISGFIFGLLFLTKPTGIVLFFIPLIFLTIKKISTNKQSYIIEFIAFISVFISTIYFWFSKHFITIIGSTINAWNWGLNYQSGLDSNSIEGWIYYFKKVPIAFGIINFSIIIILLLLFFVLNKSHIKKKFNFQDKDIWLFTFFLNFYLIASLMTTKDIRFLMPIYPLLCIYFSLIFNSANFKKYNLYWKRNLMIFSLTLSLMISLQNKPDFKFSKKTNFYKIWNHEDIIETIERNNPFVNSILAVIPDTKEINTFNLEAEAIRRGEKVRIRQVVSNIDSYKNDLKYFDWFLIKTNDQGIMTSKSKNLLQEYIIKNPAFIKQKKWILPDNSKVFLYRRKILHSYVKKIDCKSYSKNASFNQIPNGINVKFQSNGDILKNSYILIDFKFNEIKKSIDFSLGQGFIEGSLEKDSCYELSQNIPIPFGIFENKRKVDFYSRILSKDKKIEKLNTYNNFIEINQNKISDPDHILYENKILIVQKLGEFLASGEYEKLFNLVGILNQSDPKQNYLVDAEKIYQNRYSESNELNDLYSILISKILQRKINDAKNIIDQILIKDSTNGNAYFIKSILNIYLLNPRESLDAIEKSKQLNKSTETESIFKNVEGITNILNLNFKKGFQLFS